MKMNMSDYCSLGLFLLPIPICIILVIYVIYTVIMAYAEIASR